MTYEWKQIPEHDGYWISDRGEVKSPFGTILKTWPDRKGYRVTKIGDVSKKVAPLVLAAFVGPRPKGFQCSHLNGDNHNDAVSNLAWESAAENCARKLQHGTYQGGENHYKARLRREDVSAIRTKYREGQSALQLSKLYGICVRHVFHIVNREAWKYA